MKLCNPRHHLGRNFDAIGSRKDNAPAARFITALSTIPNWVATFLFDLASRGCQPPDPLSSLTRHELHGIQDDVAIRARVRDRDDGGFLEAKRTHRLETVARRLFALVKAQ